MKNRNAFPKGYNKIIDNRFVAVYEHRMTKSVVTRLKPQPKDCPFTRTELRLYTEDPSEMTKAYAQRTGLSIDRARKFVIQYRDSLPRYKDITFRGKQRRSVEELAQMIELLHARLSGLKGRRLALSSELKITDKEIKDVESQLNSLDLMDKGDRYGKN